MTYIQLLCTIPTKFDLGIYNKPFFDFPKTEPEKTIIKRNTAVTWNPSIEKKHSSEREIFIDVGNNDCLDSINNVKHWYVLSVCPGRVLFHSCVDTDTQDGVILLCNISDGCLILKKYISTTSYGIHFNEYKLSDVSFSKINIKSENVKDIHNKIWDELMQYISTVPSLSDCVKMGTADWDDYITFRQRELEKIENVYYEGQIVQTDPKNNTITCKILHESKKVKNLSKYDIMVCKNVYNNEDVATLSLKEEGRKSKKGKQIIYMFTIERCISNFLLNPNDTFYFHFKDVGSHIMLNRLTDNLNALKECNNIISIRVAQWLLDIHHSHVYKDSDNTLFEFHNQRLNTEQKDAVLQIMNTDDISFILGPPGTGKTSVISEAIYQLTKNNKTIFLSSQSNDAIDNALERLPKNIDIRPVRLGLRIQENNEFHESKLAWNMVEQLTKEVKRRNNKSIRWVKNINKKYCLFDAYKQTYPSNKSAAYYVILNNIKDRYNQNTDGYLFSKEAAEKDHVSYPPNVNKAAFYLNGVISFNNTGNLNDSFYSKLKNIERQEEIQKIFAHIIEFCSLCDNECDDIHAFLQSDNKSFVQKLFNTCNVFGITCNADSAKLTQRFMNQNVVYDYALIDEVSKATLPEILGCILKARHVVLIGDHRQLPPVFQADLDDTSEYGPHDMYRFKDLITNTIFKRLYSLANPDIKCMLKKQYRMHNEIADAAISKFYQNQKGVSLLQNGLDDTVSDSVKSHTVTINGKNGRRLVSPDHHIYWIDSTPTTTDNKKLYERREPGNTSIYNMYEVDIITSLLKDIDETAESGTSVGVISFYSLQNRKLRDNISNMSFKNIQVSANTVDKFQGQERNIIIVSLVRSKSGTIPKNNSFFKSFERINVAFSRAQNLLFIVGSVSFCKEQVVSIPSISEDSSDPVPMESDIYNSIIRQIDAMGCLFQGDEIIKENEEDNVDEGKMQKNIE